MTADDRGRGSVPVVSLRGVTRRFGDTIAVDDVSLQVSAGEMFGLIGPDGAGKTTTIRLILGLLGPEAGEIRTCGFDPSRQRAALTHRVGYLSQRFSLYGDLSVDENVAFFAEIHGVRGWKPRRDELLAMLDLERFRGRLADRLSGGMKQKLALACTLVHTPEFLVLDEPTTGVDPVSRREFWKIISRLWRQGMTILLTTPYLDEAERCGRLALMDRGRFLVVDTPEAIRSAHKAALIEIIARPRRSAVERLRGHPEVTDVEIFGERLHVTLQSPRAADDLRRDLETNGIEVEAFRPILPSLEDVFIARIRAAAAPETEVPA